MDERQSKIALNEALFREVNERLVDLNDALSNISGVMVIVCECGELGCIEQLTITESTYEQIRSNPTWFAVIPGHEIANMECLVSRHDGYDVVQKRAGTPAAEAKATDPRN